MRHVRMIGLAAVAAIAAIAAMAFVGAGSAMATGSSQLCLNNTLPCNSPAGAVHFTSVGEPLEQTTLPKLHLQCLSGLLAGTAEALKNPTGIAITSLTWTGCYTLLKGATHNCEVTTITLGLLDILKTAANLGTGTLLGTEVLLKCGELIHCIYGGKETKGLTGEGALHTATAGHGRITAPGIAMPPVGGFLCPATSTLTVTYESLTHLWISS